MPRPSKPARPTPRFAPAVVPLEDRVTPAAGDLDLSFSGDGKQTVAFDLGGANADEANAVAVQADGKIVVVGTAQRSGNAEDTDFAITRLNADGSLDTTFGTGGRQTVAFDLGGVNADEANAVAIQADGKIVVAGFAQRAVDADSDFGVARLNPDGSLDTTFDGDGRQTIAFDLAGNFDGARAVAVQADGRIVVAGTAEESTTAGVSDNFGVVRLNADGSLDTTFDADGRQTVAFDLGGGNADRVRAVALQADGRIVLTGFVEVNDASGFSGDFGVARLNSNGGLDLSFSGDGRQTVAFNLGGDNLDDPRAVAVQADGRIVVAGSATITGFSGDFGVVRLNADGGLDTTFDADGRQTVAFDLGGENDDVANAVAVQPDGTIVVAGSAERNAATDFDFALARLSPTGVLDPVVGRRTVAFDLGGAGQESDTGLAVAIQPDRKIVLAGRAERNATSDADFAVARLLGDNRPPEAVDDTASAVVPVPGGGPVTINVLANDTEPDGDPVTVSIVSQPANGSAVANADGTVTYTPNGMEGPDTFVYRIDDGQGGTDTATVTVNVTRVEPPPANRPPVAVADVATTAAATAVAVNVLANDTDPDGDPVTVTVTGQPANGTATVNDDGVITYTPNAGFSGSDTFLYQISDGRGGMASAAVTVTVTPPPPANRAPQAVADTFLAPFNTAVTLDVLANDTEPDGDPVTVSLAANPAHGTATVNADGSLTYTPTAGFVGDDTFSYQVRDGRGGVATAAVTVTVQARRFALPREFGVGLDRGGNGSSRLFNPDRSERFSTTSFTGSSAAGVRTATGDFNGDGVADLVIGTGPGGVTRVRVLDGKTQQELFSVQPFEDRFTGGVYVAAGDVTGDGVADLVITPDEGGGPRVRVFSGAGFGQVADFFGIEDTAFRGGARAGVADLTGDGVGDLLVAAGFGGGPRVAVFDGTSLANGAFTRKPFPDFFAFEVALRNGVYIAGGDVNGDGFAELIAGGGPGGGPRVRAFDGRALVQTNTQVDDANFFAGDTTNRGGIRVAAKDLDGDGRADIVAGAGPGGGSRVTAYRGSTVTPNGTPPELFAFDAQPGFSGGVFVG